jgi:hypothetical protein
MADYLKIARSALALKAAPAYVPADARVSTSAESPDAEAARGLRSRTSVPESARLSLWIFVSRVGSDVSPYGLLQHERHLRVKSGQALHKPGARKRASAPVVEIPLPSSRSTPEKPTALAATPDCTQCCY